MGITLISANLSSLIKLYLLWRRAQTVGRKRASRQSSWTKNMVLLPTRVPRVARVLREQANVLARPREVWVVAMVPERMMLSRQLFHCLVSKTFLQIVLPLFAGLRPQWSPGTAGGLQVQQGLKGEAPAPRGWGEHKGLIPGGMEGVEPKWRAWSQSGGPGAKVPGVLGFLPGSVTSFYHRLLLDCF